MGEIPPRNWRFGARCTLRDSDSGYIEEIYLGLLTLFFHATKQPSLFTGAFGIVTRAADFRPRREVIGSFGVESLPQTSSGIFESSVSSENRAGVCSFCGNARLLVPNVWHS